MRIIVCFFIAFLLLITFSSFSQNKNVSSQQPALYEYYAYLSGVNERNDVLELQKLIQHKDGVIYFMAERFPVRCFVLRSSRKITELEFKKWLPVKYAIMTYGEGDKAKEAAYKIYNLSKKSIH